MKQQINRSLPKTLSPAQRGASFTLIEMLAVIAIIMMLAGMIFTGLSGSLKQTYKTRALSDANSIKQAINAYYTDYGKWPSCGNGTALASQADIMAVLGGAELTASGQTCFIGGIAYSANPKKMAYLTPSKRDTCTDSSGNVFWVDPWKVPYNIAMDLNYDNQITGADTAYLGTTTCTTISPLSVWNSRPSAPTVPLAGNVVTAGVAVWSNGPDIKNGWGDSNFDPGDGSRPGKDDIGTWNR